MRLPTVHFAIAATIAAAPSWGTAQAQANPANCTLPPPLVCPPDPPPGPKTVGQVDDYLKNLNGIIGAIASAPLSSGWTASPAATAEIVAYGEDLKTYRDQVADYREKISPGGDPAEAVAQEAAPSGPE